MASRRDTLRGGLAAKSGTCAKTHHILKESILRRTHMHTSRHATSLQTVKGLPAKQLFTTMHICVHGAVSEAELHGSQEVHVTLCNGLGKACSLTHVRLRGWQPTQWQLMCESTRNGAG